MGWFLTILVHFFGLILVLGVIIKIYSRWTLGWCKSHTCLVGKTAIITGANTGIGYETALDFAKRGARVILACRDRKRAEEACSRITEETGNSNIIVKIIDMSSFDSVRAFAKDINATEERLDILVNNAGALGITNQKSKDGCDLLMQINHFSNFLLTNLLVGLLTKSQPSRIINVSSILARRATNFNLAKVNQIEDRDKYPDSKLCNILFTIELARRLEGTGVTTYSLHPGFVKTEILRHFQGLRKQFWDLLVNLYSKNSEEGAQTTIHCSVSKGIEHYNGEHFEDCHKVATYSTATVPGLPKKLWEMSEDIVQLKPQERQI